MIDYDNLRLDHLRNNVFGCEKAHYYIYLVLIYRVSKKG